MNHLEDKGDATRTKTVRVRVSLSEKLAIIENAKTSRMTISDLLRTRATDAKPLRRKPSPDREVLLKLLAELNKQGSNLNQLARACWRRQDSDEYEMPIQAIMYMLSQIKPLTDRLREILTSHADDKR